ncbi:rhomboid family intramembrane serine protease [Bacillus sp. FJAT-47783]|uniref:rhomboid family protein n=1 Tax=Bacillus sp. FJAT-47783 TaxID=2922712 RepID=UPI001FAB3B2D|nr:rhomboid family intramembrane serine protease [Bacillus sp. FJAT-47783]
MIIQQDFLFWKLIEQFVMKHRYRLIHISPDHREVWLEPSGKGDVQLLRLKRIDVDWGNWLARDMNDAVTMFEAVRKESLKRNLNVLNVYISTYEPVDDWHIHVEKPMQQGHTTLKTIFIDLAHVHNRIVQLEEILGISLVNVEKDGQREKHDYEELHHIKQGVLNFVNQNMKQERELFEHGKPFFTKVFLLIQIFMFVVLELFGGSTNTDTLLKFGAKVNELIYAGEWWRFVTPIFLHIGFLHLLMNSFALYYIGVAVEKMYGSLRFLFIYLFAGITGTIASFVFSPAISAGASGAIFGLFGSLLLLGLLKPNLFFRTIGPNILIVIAINLSLGFAIPNIDNAGHIGGLIGGFVAALIVQLPKMSRNTFRLVGIALSVMMITSLLYYGFKLMPERDSYAAIAVSKQYLAEGEFKRANDILWQANKLEDAPPEVTFLLAVSQLELGEMEKAIPNLLHVIKTDPTYHQAYYVLSVAYHERNELHKATEAINEAIRLDPKNDVYRSFKSTLQLQ